MLTLIFGLTVLVTGKDAVFRSRYAILVLMGAMAALLVSAVIAIVVQAHGFEYRVMSDDALKSLTRDNKEWARRADDATRAWVKKQVSTICTLRVGNNTKATQIAWSLWLQVSAISLLSISVGIELWGRVSA
jgi:hypothetical protein